MRNKTGNRAGRRSPGRLGKWLPLLCGVAFLVAACGDDDADDVRDAIGDVSVGDVAGDGVGGDVAPPGDVADAVADAAADDVADDVVPDVSEREPLVVVADETLGDLATVVTVPGAVSVGPGWLVIHEDSGGSPGPVIGFEAVADGSSEDVAVTLDRPAVDGETLFAMLHVDRGTVGDYEFPGDDVPARDNADAVVVAPFVVTVPADTPAVRFQVSAEGLVDYVFDSVEPAAYTEDTIGALTTDPPLTLRVGWRYEVVNTVAAEHPFELVEMGATAAEDVVLASQFAAGNGWETDADVAWAEDGDNVRFTVTSDFAAVLTGYRCGFHVTDMRAAITTVSEE